MLSLTFMIETGTLSMAYKALKDCICLATPCFAYATPATPTFSLSLNKARMSEHDGLCLFPPRYLSNSLSFSSDFFSSITSKENSSLTIVSKWPLAIPFLTPLPFCFSPYSLSLTKFMLCISLFTFLLRYD